MITKTSLISLRNLDLALSRILTAKNHQHKRMFRHIYQAYEPGRRANLLLLHEKLRGGWKATRPIRIYMPKPSGLLRPLTLLTLEDQIVLQAIANQVAKQTFERRRDVQGQSVFSNCLSKDPNSIFFLQDWRSTYHQFQVRLARHLAAGNQWIAHFDLAAFYETISHRALQTIVAPSGGGNELWSLIREWLCVWTSEQGGIPVDHGIPQGPMASDFLAEVFLLPLDEAMKRTGIPYIRYVDDIRVLAKSEEEARRAAIVLEIECRRWSLIPQGSKFKVSHARTIAEALGTLPSIAESTGRDVDEGELDDASAVSILRDAIKGRPPRVVDKSRLRYVLYRAGASPSVLQRTIDLLPRHPEHIDAFAAYLQNYSKSRPVERLVWSMLGSGVLYDYVEAELWMIAARMGSAQTLAGLLQRAQLQARRRPLSFSMRRALLTFFVSCRNVGVYTNGMTIKRLRAQTPYIQSLIVPHFVSGDFKAGGIASELVKAALPGMVLAGQMVDRSITVEELGVQVAELEPEVRNVFHGLGLIEGPKQPRFDQVGDVLRIRYGIPYWKGWRGLLASNYQHALQVLLTAENKFLPDSSGWLSSQNSFNDAVFRALQAYLQSKGLPGAMTMLDPKGKLHPFGRLLDKDTAFSRAFPTMSASLRAGNDRRNSIPDSHPFEFKSGKRTKRLRVRERDELKAKFTSAYGEIVTFVNAQP